MKVAALKAKSQSTPVKSLSDSEAECAPLKSRPESYAECCVDASEEPPPPRRRPSLMRQYGRPNGKPNFDLIFAYNRPSSVFTPSILANIPPYRPNFDRYHNEKVSYEETYRNRLRNLDILFRYDRRYAQMVNWIDRVESFGHGDDDMSFKFKQPKEHLANAGFFIWKLIP